MNEILKNIIDKTMELKYYYVCDTLEREELNNSEEYKDLLKDEDKIINELKLKSPKNLQVLINKLIDIKDYQSNCYGKYYFKQGVKAGLTDLKCLGEAEEEVTML
ncbi:hypothetical protein [Clostridium pasteurianum]|uniref:Uncharacterized protein n=1 Tax=Clostridium pasteurianum BC1 TaxID=86416 RepID=R4JY24_CLOPA|nr:hypothetical protein [Clostridium pasteurianum]AGK95183.1 hypothetical protein Clopa_0083 [Clostridium pasteurianum BC1]